MPQDRSEIPVSLVLKPRDFVINADDPVVVNYVGGVFEVVFEAGFIKYLSVWNSRCVRSLVNIAVRAKPYKILPGATLHLEANTCQK